MRVHRGGTKRDKEILKIISCFSNTIKMININDALKIARQIETDVASTSKTPTLANLIQMY